MIKKQTIQEFLDKTASSAATPGGGAVAAVTGAMAASLVEMVATLTVGKKGYEEVEKSMQQVVRETKSIREELLILADEDVLAFNVVMHAYKIEKGTKGREEKIKKALILAIDVPQRVSDFADKLIELGEYVSENGNKNALSDAKTAIYLAKAARAGAEENVKINKEALAKL